MSLLSKQIIVPMVLVSLLAAALFGFVIMVSMPDGQMAGDCPFSVAGSSLCPQNIVNMVIHHISAYHSFFNITIDSSLIAAITSLFLMAGFLISLPSLFGPPPLSLYRRNNLSLTTLSPKLVRWLSLFENSPAR